MASMDDQKTLWLAMAADLRLLSALHGGELTADQLEELRAHPFQEYLGLMLRSEVGLAALAAVDAALAATKTVDIGKIVDEHAADFADIYLTGRFRTAPSESAWTHPEGLERQEAMFAVRTWYKSFGLGVENWRVLQDDHLVAELEFVAHLLESEPVVESIVAAGAFMDRHLLAWAPAFFARVAARAATPFYAALAGLSAAYLEETRQLLEVLTGQRRTPQTEKVGADRPAKSEDQPYFPGLAPSW